MPCPGLTLSSSDDHNWYLPKGFKESQRTVCSECCEAYNIQGTLTRLGPSNCDSYLYRNKGSDNGIFNFSVWSANRKILYPSDPGDSCVYLPGSELGLELEPGLNLFISAYGLKPGQVYTWSLHKDNDDLIEQSPPDLYYLTTAITSFTYCSTFKSLVIKIHLYNLKKQDPFTMTGDHGLVTITGAGIFTDANKVLLQPGYSSGMHDIHMYTKFEPFTVEPVKHTIRFRGREKVSAKSP